MMNDNYIDLLEKDRLDSKHLGICECSEVWATILNCGLSFTGFPTNKEDATKGIMYWTCFFLNRLRETLSPWEQDAEDLVDFLKRDFDSLYIVENGEIKKFKYPFEPDYIACNQEDNYNFHVWCEGGEFFWFEDINKTWGINPNNIKPEPGYSFGFGNYCGRRDEK